MIPFAVTRQLASLAIFAGALTGCQIKSPSQYVSPQVTGRVLDAKTREPLAGVAVQRVSNRPVNPDQPVKGGEILEKTAPVVTGSDGRFELLSLRSVALFRRLSWFTVTVDFTRSDYERFTTNYLYSQSTTNAAGVPLINAGDVLLIPVTK